MKTYTIEWERESVITENLTFVEMLDTLAQLVADDFKEFGQNDIEAVIEEYYIDEYNEEGEQTNGADTRADIFLLLRRDKSYTTLYDKIEGLIAAKKLNR